MYRFLTPLLLAASIGLAAPALASPPTIDINKATQAELETVKGIGPAMSAKILAARKGGDFKNWDDLVQRVSGMGPGNARRMSDAGLRIGTSAFPGASAAAAKAPREGSTLYRSPRPAAGAAEPPRGEAARPSGVPLPAGSQG